VFITGGQVKKWSAAEISFSPLWGLLMGNPRQCVWGKAKVKVKANKPCMDITWTTDRKRPGKTWGNFFINLS